MNGKEEEEGLFQRKFLLRVERNEGSGLQSMCVKRLLFAYPSLLSHPNTTHLFPRRMLIHF